MGLTPRLEVRQSQNLTLTPQLMQSIRLLQLSHLELNAFVEAELLRNPLLEREDGAEPGRRRGGAAGSTRAELSAYEDTVDHGDRIQSADSIADGYDTEVENVFPEQAAQDRHCRAPVGRAWRWRRRRGPRHRPVRRGASVAQRASLGQQIGLLLNDPAERMIARFLIDGLNEAGYLTIELEPLPSSWARRLGGRGACSRCCRPATRSGCSPATSANASRCSCGSATGYDPLMQRLLDHLDLLAAHDLRA
jgi:RNA polymerase sigma-54 factor